MDWVQLVNATAALIAFGASQVALVQLQPTTGRPAVLLLHLVHSTILLWYAIVNAALGTGLMELELESVVPLFRYAFAPLLLTYSLRQWVASRSVVQWHDVAP